MDIIMPQFKYKSLLFRNDKFKVIIELDIMLQFRTPLLLLFMTMVIIEISSNT